MNDLILNGIFCGGARESLTSKNTTLVNKSNGKKSLSIFVRQYRDQMLTKI